jgi:hypothetical protein
MRARGPTVGTVRREDSELNHAGDEKQIRTLIEHWTAAVHSLDITGVLWDEVGDIVMFDVPPPEEGARGIDAYGQTWPSSFQGEARGALSRIASPDVRDSKRRRQCARPAALRIGIDRVLIHLHGPYPYAPRLDRRRPTASMKTAQACQIRRNGPSHQRPVP